MRDSHFRDEIEEIEETIPNKELIISTILEFSNSWNSFAVGINSWKEAPSFKELWFTCTREKAILALI